jgi:hypothetical protein
MNLGGQSAPRRPLSPKEFAAEIGDVRSPQWVREQIAAGHIRTVDPDAPKRPYLIPASELDRFISEGVAS